MLCGDNKLGSLFWVPTLNPDMMVYCDDDMCKKYGFDTSENGIAYKDLMESPAYKSEAAIYRMSAKKQEEKQKILEKRKSEFAAFKKQFSIEEY
jgi:hypothetical protein